MAHPWVPLQGMSHVSKTCKKGVKRIILEESARIKAPAKSPDASCRAWCVSLLASATLTNCICDSSFRACGLHFNKPLEITGWCDSDSQLAGEPYVCLMRFWIADFGLWIGALGLLAPQHLCKLAPSFPT